MQNEKIKNLKFLDIFILTLIMFSYFIYSSNFLHLDDFSSAQTIEFTSKMNYEALILQLILLILAFFYLWLRRFDFSILKIKFDIKSILLGIFIFVGVSLIFDLYFMIVDEIILFFYDVDFYENQAISLVESKFSHIDFSLIIYSLLNGFYEEIFFLGLCLSVTSKNIKFAFLYSLVIRYSFHTYQGTISAIAIGLILGTIYYVLYTKMRDKNLTPFFISHCFGDIFGMGIVNYIMF